MKFQNYFYLPTTNGVFEPHWLYDINFLFLREPIEVKETGRLPNGKRFGTGSVGQMDFFADKLFNLLYAAIDAEYPAYTGELDEQDLLEVQHELHSRRFV